jgi:hypothetical protein
LRLYQETFRLWKSVLIGRQLYTSIIFLELTSVQMKAPEENYDIIGSYHISSFSMLYKLNKLGQSVNSSNLYSWCDQLKHWLRHWLFWGLLWFFFTPSRQMPLYVKSDNDCIDLPIHYSLVTPPFNVRYWQCH